MWRDVAPTLADLKRHRFVVTARCLVCSLEMEVRPEIAAQARGWDYVLWGRSVPCRRFRCGGRMWFACIPPRLGQRVPMW